IFFFLGQSNMVGQGLSEEFPSDMLLLSNSLVRLTDDGWILQKTHPYLNGPEISFLYEMKKNWPNETIGVIKVALSGTGIRVFQPNWSFIRAEVEKGDGWKGPMYLLIKERIEKANRWCIPEYMGVFWKQGLTDMKYMRSARDYGNILKEIITNIRKDTGIVDLPFFVGTYFTQDELNQSETQELISQYRPLEPSMKVLNDQIAAEILIPYTKTVYHGWLPVKEDGSIHFNTTGQIELGKYFAVAYLSYLEDQ
ncbi:MAG: sialate O-acetylesterase, partial [Candidatus Thermoplasmatota archaeon]|nr:sialate O-acetylesterase [Candidatus Thermoplasmatota archaeon]MBU1941759.1 sialate O-acetylesterase [Candidatus Thermoplasmatota archaeon]